MLKRNDIAKNQINSLLLAAAVVELFPQALLVEGQGTEICFFYDIFFPFDFEPSLLGVIEDRMRIIHKEDRVLRALEMNSNNAALWMEHQKQYLVAKKIKTAHLSLVTIGQLGEFATWIPNFNFDKIESPFTAKLQEGFPVCSLIPGLVRVVGVVNKSCKRKRLFWQKHNHLQLVCDMHLFMPLGDQQGWVWLPKAEVIKEQLLNWWKRESRDAGVEFVTTPYLLANSKHLSPVTAYHKEVFLSFQKKTNRLAELALALNSTSNDVCQGLFQSSCFLVDYTHVFCNRENLLKECISSLQFILKTPKILGFDFEIILRSSRGKIRKKNDLQLSIMQTALENLQLDYRIEKKGYSDFTECVEIHIADSLRRWWSGPFLKILEGKEGDTLLRSIFGNLERIVCLLIETTGAELPSWLADENQRIV